MKINELLAEQKLEEGSMGAGVGAGLGALAGSALGPLGTGAGAALGGAAGNWIGNKASNAWQTLKKGYRIGRNATSSDDTLPSSTGSTATTNTQSQPEISVQSAPQSQPAAQDQASSPAGTTSAGTASADPTSIRQQKQAAAAKAAQDQMAASSSTQPSRQPATPSDSDVHPRFGPRRRPPEVQPTTSGETPQSALSYFFPSGSLPSNTPEPVPQSLQQVQPSSQSQSQPAAAGQSVTQTPKATVKQVKQSIGSLKTRDLLSVKGEIDKIITNRQSKSQRGAGDVQAPPATATPNLTVQQGGKKRKTASRSAAQSQATGTVEESIFYSKFLKMDI